jgi:hypothetical protein
MGSEIQQIVVYAVVALAGAYVLWTVVARFWSRGKSCGSACSGCGSTQKALAEKTAFVGIESIQMTNDK